MPNNKVMNSIKKKQHGRSKRNKVYPIHVSSFNCMKKPHPSSLNQNHQELMIDAAKLLNKKYLPAINKLNNPNLINNMQNSLKIAKKKLSKPLNIITDQFAIIKEEKFDVNLKINNDENQDNKLDSNVVLQSLKPCSVVLKTLPFENISNKNILICNNRNACFKQSNQITSYVEGNRTYLISPCSVVLKKLSLKIIEAETCKSRSNKFFRQSNITKKTAKKKKKNIFITSSNTKKSKSFDEGFLTFGAVNKFEIFPSTDQPVQQHSLHLKKVNYSSSHLTKSFEKSPSQLTSCITSSKGCDVKEKSIIEESKSTEYFLRKRNSSVSYAEEEIISSDEVSECCSKCDVINSCCEFCDFPSKKTKESVSANNKSNKLFKGNKKCGTYKLKKDDFKRTKFNSKASKYPSKQKTSVTSKYTRKYKTSDASKYTRKNRITKTSKFQRKHTSNFSNITSSKACDVKEKRIIEESKSTEYFLRKRNSSISYAEEEIISLDEVSKCCSKCDVINSCCEFCDFPSKKTKKSVSANNKSNKLFNGNKKCGIYKLKKDGFKRAKFNSKASKYPSKQKTSVTSKYKRKYKASDASKYKRKYKASDASKYTRKNRITKVSKFQRKHASNFSSTFLPVLDKKAILSSQNQNPLLHNSNWSKLIKPCSVVLSNIIKPCFVRLTPINFQLTFSDVPSSDVTHINTSDETIYSNKVSRVQTNSYESIEKVLTLKDIISHYSKSLLKKSKITSFKSLDKNKSVLLIERIKLNMSKQQNENRSELISKANLVNNMKTSFISFNKVHLVRNLSHYSDLFFQHRLINRNCLLECYSNANYGNSKYSFFTFIQFVYYMSHCSGYNDNCFKQEWTVEIKLNAIKNILKDLALKCKNSNVSFLRKLTYFISKKFAIDSSKTITESSCMISNNKKLNSMRNMSKNILEPLTRASTQPGVDSYVPTVCKKSNLLAYNLNLTKPSFYKSQNYVSESTIAKSKKTIEQLSDQYECDQCSVKFISSKALYYHLCLSKVKKGFLCNICEKYFDLYRALKKHKLSHSNKSILKRSNRVKNREASESTLKKIDPSKELDEKLADTSPIVAQSKNRKRSANFGEKENSFPKKRIPKIYVPFEMLNHASTSSGIYSRYSKYSVNQML